jgi:hypothetical protein
VLVLAYLGEGLRADIERLDRGERLKPFSDDEAYALASNALAIEVLGSEEAAREWMSSPQELIAAGKSGAGRDGGHANGSCPKSSGRCGR